MKKFFVLVAVCLFANALFATHTLEEFSPGVQRAQTTQKIKVKIAPDITDAADIPAVEYAFVEADDAEKFYVFNVLGDGDCGFFALETTRKDVLKEIREQLDDVSVLSLLQYEARDYYADKDFAKSQAFEHNFTKSDAEAFLKARYEIPEGAENGQQYYLEAVPPEDLELELAGGVLPATGLIDWIARYHKKVNVNVWQWNVRQEREHGVKLIKKIITHPDARTIDIVQGQSHFSRLVNVAGNWTAANGVKALAHERYWKKVCDQVQAESHAAALRLANQDDEISRAIALSLAQSVGGAASSHVPYVASANVKKFSKKIFKPEEFVKQRLPLEGDEDGVFSTKVDTELCISRLVLPVNAVAKKKYAINFNAQIGGRVAYLQVRSKEKENVDFKKGRRVVKQQYLKLDGPDISSVGISVEVAANQAVFVFLYSPWSGGAGNEIRDLTVTELP